MHIDVEPLTFSGQYLTVYSPEVSYFMKRQVWLLTIPRSAHTVYLCVLCGSENKQRLFHYTALTDWFV